MGVVGGKRSRRRSSVRSTSVYLTRAAFTQKKPRPQTRAQPQAHTLCLTPSNDERREAGTRAQETAARQPAVASERDVFFDRARAVEAAHCGASPNASLARAPRPLPPSRPMEVFNTAHRRRGVAGRAGEGAARQGSFATAVVKEVPLPLPLRLPPAPRPRLLCTSPITAPISKMGINRGDWGAGEAWMAANHRSFCMMRAEEYISALVPLSPPFNLTLTRRRRQQQGHQDQGDGLHGGELGG